MRARVQADCRSFLGRHHQNLRPRWSDWDLARHLNRLVRPPGCFRPRGHNPHPFLKTINLVEAYGVYELRTKASSVKLKRGEQRRYQAEGCPDTPWATVVVVATTAAAAVLVVGHDQTESGIAEDRTNFFPHFIKLGASMFDFEPKPEKLWRNKRKI